jgi:hypothetical protein
LDKKIKKKKKRPRATAAAAKGFQDIPGKQRATPAQRAKKELPRKKKKKTRGLLASSIQRCVGTGRREPTRHPPLHTHTLTHCAFGFVIFSSSALFLPTSK